MKFKVLALGLLSFSSFLLLGANFAKKVSAQCVQADISIQSNISGSKQPTKRSNDVVLESDGSCTGNSSVTTGVQSNVGGNGRVEQRRQVRQRIQGGSDNGTGVNGTTIQIKTNPQIDVYNPADNLRR